MGYLAPLESSRKVVRVYARARKAMNDAGWQRMQRLVDAIGGDGLDRARVAEAVGLGGNDLDAALDEMRAAGLELVSDSDGRLRLGTPVEWLDRDAILSAAREADAGSLGTLLLERLTDSTNARLLALADRDPGPAVCLAEGQTAGRGRRGRTWVSPLGANLYLSLLRRFDAPPAALSTLPLAVGVVVAQEVEALGVGRVALKWPNDVLVAGRKLGGILVESKASGGAISLVVGVGVNLALPAGAASAIEQAFTDLRSELGHPAPRNRFAGRLAGRLSALVAGYPDRGFEPWRTDWEARDYLRGQPVETQGSGERIEGMAAGIAGSGALKIETADGGVAEVHSGEVSVRVR